MQILRRSELAFEGSEELEEMVFDVIEDCTDQFGELEVEDSGLIDLIEDLASLQVWEVVDLFVALIEAGGTAETFITECLDRWHFTEPDLHEEVVNALDSE